MKPTRATLVKGALSARRIERASGAKAIPRLLKALLCEGSVVRAELYLYVASFTRVARDGHPDTLSRYRAVRSIPTISRVPPELRM